MTIAKRAFLTALSLSAITATFAALVPVAKAVLVTFVIGHAIAHSGGTGQQASEALSKDTAFFTFVFWLIRSVTGMLIGLAVATILTLPLANEKSYKWLFFALPLIGVLLCSPFPELTKQIVDFHDSLFGGSSSFRGEL